MAIRLTNTELMTQKNRYRFFIILLCLSVVITAWTSSYAGIVDHAESGGMAAVPATVFQADKDSRDSADLLAFTVSSCSFSCFASTDFSPVISGYLQPVISPALRPPAL